MFSSAEEILSYIANEGVKFVDIRFTDLPGVQQHFNVPAATFDADFFTDGQLFDGSSIRGFAAIHESDMQLIPDLTTAYVDPFRTAKTLNLNFSIFNPRTGEPYEPRPAPGRREGRGIPRLTGIADTAFFGPEAEFYVFDDVRYESSRTTASTTSTPIEGAWNTGRDEEGGNLGYKTRFKGGYFPVPPLDHHADLRDDMSHRADRRPASRSSAPTTRSAPPARPRSTTSSTRCSTPPTTC